jgi:hypothetical protein
MMTREQHLAWCKQRAYQEFNYHNTQPDDEKQLQKAIDQAVLSFFSDSAKHEGTINHPDLQLGFMLRMHRHMTTEAQLRQWIDGFN